VRANFGKEPEKMSEKEFATLAAEAIWLETYRADRMKAAIAEVAAKMFGDGRS
jgi:hypothetical protein